MRDPSLCHMTNMYMCAGSGRITSYTSAVPQHSDTMYTEVLL